MRTTLDLPKELLDEAMKITQTKTKTGVIVLALEELITKTKISKLKRYKGTLDLEINLDELRDRTE